VLCGNTPHALPATIARAQQISSQRYQHLHRLHVVPLHLHHKDGSIVYDEMNSAGESAAPTHRAEKLSEDA
jgi:hypothetical protein